jgi:hypothetical protein
MAIPQGARRAYRSAKTCPAKRTCITGLFQAKVFSSRQEQVATPYSAAFVQSGCTSCALLQGTISFATRKRVVHPSGDLCSFRNPVECHETHVLLAPTELCSGFHVPENLYSPFIRVSRFLTVSHAEHRFHPNMALSYRSGKVHGLATTMSYRSLMA